MTSSLFKLVGVHIRGNVFLTFLITKISLRKLGAYALAKIFLYFEILAGSPALYLGIFSLHYSLYSAKGSLLTTTALVLILLWYI